MNEDTVFESFYVFWDQRRRYGDPNALSTFSFDRYYSTYVVNTWTESSGSTPTTIYVFPQGSIKINFSRKHYLPVLYYIVLLQRSAPGRLTLIYNREIILVRWRIDVFVIVSLCFHINFYNKPSFDIFCFCREEKTNQFCIPFIITIRTCIYIYIYNYISLLTRLHYQNCLYSAASVEERTIEIIIITYFNLR